MSAGKKTISLADQEERISLTIVATNWSGGDGAVLAAWFFCRSSRQTSFQAKRLSSKRNRAFPAVSS
jgi:hypothetical protein